MSTSSARSPLAASGVWSSPAQQSNKNEAPAAFRGEQTPDETAASAAAASAVAAATDAAVAAAAAVTVQARVAAPAATAAALGATATSTDPAVDKEIRDSGFSVTRRLGGGSFGTVWSATRGKDTVAIKKIHNVFGRVSDAKSTLREMQLMRHFAHPNVLGLREILRPASRDGFDAVYLVTELMDADLGRVLDSPQALNDDHVLAISYQVLCGVAHLHSAGVLHRDLKPANVLMDRRNNVKICDLGMGRWSGGPQLNKTLLESVSTRCYRAPEGLLDARHYTAAVDVWAIGCVLYELYARRPLFLGGAGAGGSSNEEHLARMVALLGSPSDADIEALTPAEHAAPLVQHLRALPLAAQPGWAALLPEAPPSFHNVLARCLVWAPDARATARQLAAMPYFADVHDDDDFATAAAPWRDPPTDASVTKDELRDLIFNLAAANAAPVPLAAVAAAAATAAPPRDLSRFRDWVA